jgi:hypothetical protein
MWSGLSEIWWFSKYIFVVVFVVIFVAGCIVHLLAVVLLFIVVFLYCSCAFLCLICVNCLLYCCTTATGLKPNCSLTNICIQFSFPLRSLVSLTTTHFSLCLSLFPCKHNIQTNSVNFRLQANYTDWATATCRRNLLGTFVDRGMSRGQRGATPTAVLSVF